MNEFFSADLFLVLMFFVGFALGVLLGDSK